MERRQRPVLKAAVLFQAVAGDFFVNRLDPGGGVTDHEPQGDGKPHEDQGMQPERQHRQQVQQRHRNEKSSNAENRPQARPQPLPHQDGAGQA